MYNQNIESEMYLKFPVKANIFSIDLYDNLCNSGSQIELPATSDKIQDVLDKARISSEDEYRITELIWNQHCFEGDILKNAKIEELNFLAWRLKQMDDHHGLMYEACLKMKGKDITIKDMINLTYALDNCHVGYHISDDEELGKFAAEGDFIKELCDIPDEVWDYIDFKKVGKRMREADNGIFIKECYVACDIENITEVYDGITLPQNILAEVGLFNLLISKAPIDDNPTDKQARWLYLPASEQQLTEFLKELGAESFTECVYYELSTTIPKIQDLFFNLSQLEQLNSLAKCISKQELRKCKAVLDYMDCNSIEQAIDFCENLQRFDYYPDFFHPSDYGKHIFNLKQSGVEKSLYKYFSFEPYGREQMHLNNAKATPYGFVSRNENKMVIKYGEPDKQEISGFEM